MGISPTPNAQGPPPEDRQTPERTDSSRPGLPSFAAFAESCAAIGRAPGKLEKIRVLAEYLRPLEGSAAALAATWFSGRPFPAAQNKTLQLGGAVLGNALAAAAGVDASALEAVYFKHSDAGDTAYEVLRELRPAATQPERSGTGGTGGTGRLLLQDVNVLFQRLHAARGPLGKAPLLVEALNRCSADEARVLYKIITGDLRIGLKEGLVEEAVAQAFAAPADAVRRANLLLGDVGETARLAAENRLEQATLVPFRPVKFMLASPEPTAAKVWERLRGDAGKPGNAPAGEPAVWLEDKYDGVRSQLHKVGERVALYSRDLKEITGTFLELADSGRRMTADVILDGEIVAMRGNNVAPFAELQRRLGRHEPDLFLREELPVRFIAFDLLWLNGQTRLDEPLRERRRQLEALVLPDCFSLAQITPAASVAEIEAAFAAARARGNEGLMIKDPAGSYTPGRRGLSWLKLKRPYATLDCVVVGAEFGHGKRGKLLSDYTFAVRDERTGQLKTIGKAYTGLTDGEIDMLTRHFQAKAINRHGRYFEVEPDTVLEIAFDRIQSSERHTSGFALRFPRIVRLRPDKPVAEIDTVETARKLALRLAVGADVRRL